MNLSSGLLCPIKFSPQNIKKMRVREIKSKAQFIRLTKYTQSAKELAAEALKRFRWKEDQAAILRKIARKGWYLGSVEEAGRPFGKKHNCPGEGAVSLAPYVFKSFGPLRKRDIYPIAL